MTKTMAVALGMTVVVAVACKSKKSGEEGGSKAASAGAQSAGKDAAPANETTRPDIAEAEVQTVIDSWLQAQNEGDFDSYQALYADKFTGVKRAGSRTTRFARKGWLADRQRMFKRPMKVEAKDLTISSTPTTAQVNFVQYWASGKFADQGPKRMLIVKDGDALKIAQEEMLRSQLVDAVSSDGEGQLYFLLEGGVALPDALVPDTIGKIELDEGEPMVASATLTTSDLEEDDRALMGKKFRTDSGCEAAVVGFSVVSRATPHFGTVHMWDCQHEDDDCVPATDADKADTIYGSGTPVVVAELDGCGEDRYAWPADNKAPVKAEVITDDAIAKKALAAFAALPAVKAQADDGMGQRQDNWYGGLETVDIFKHPETGAVLVSVMADNKGSCGEFSASHWQLWSYQNGKLVEVAGGTPPMDILEAIDSDGDGTLELVVRGDDFGTELALIDSETLVSIQERSYAYNDCPC